MSDRSLAWHCCFCDWEIKPLSSDLWMTTARAIYLVDDQAYISDVKFSARRCNYSYDRWLDYPDSRVANLVHNCCWEIFTRHFKDDHLDLKRLFHVMSKMPEEYYRYRYFRAIKWLPVSKKWHPFTTGFTYMGASLPYFTRKYAIRESGAVIHANPTDPFSCLPIEIMEEIAACTDMVDYLNLRLSSRVMSSLFHTQIFWRHRFNIHMERGFLNCLVEEDKEEKNSGRANKRDWHQIYYKTQPARMLRMYGHRKSCQRILVKYWYWLKLILVGDICVRTKIPVSEAEQRLVADACWHTMNRQILTGFWKWKPEIPQECEVTENIILPEALVKIGIWVFRTPLGSFIAGMEFITDSMVTDKAFGYRIPGERHVIDIGAREHFRGFEVCSDDDRICAIRVYTTRATSASDQPLELHSSAWVGSPTKIKYDKPDTDIRSLISNKEVLAVQAGFEDYKLTALAIGTCIKAPTETMK